ncbi:hypothetical protein J6590_012590 [Homalodisca vitripennis]|nr:hypothetical protein J6590_012590 [Homalodisca vitripennis]
MFIFCLVLFAALKCQSCAPYLLRRVGKDSFVVVDTPMRSCPPGQKRDSDGNCRPLVEGNPYQGGSGRPGTTGGGQSNTGFGNNQQHGSVGSNHYVDNSDRPSSINGDSHDNSYQQQGSSSNNRFPDGFNRPSSNHNDGGIHSPSQHYINAAQY